MDTMISTHLIIKYTLTGIAGMYALALLLRGWSRIWKGDPGGKTESNTAIALGIILALVWL